MKASELIARLQALIAEHGDLPIGYENAEYGVWESVRSINLRKAHRTGKSYTDDDEALGNRFLGIWYA